MGSVLRRVGHQRADEADGDTRTRRRTAARRWYRGDGPFPLTSRTDQSDANRWMSWVVASYAHRAGEPPGS